jgi:hypothetical protein
MVNIGFICEGETEKLIIESDRFKQFLFDNNCELIKVIDATGNGNLLPKNISPFIQILNDEGAQKIFILTDLDIDVCITQTKQRINAPDGVIVIIAVQQIESWFLADSETLSIILEKISNLIFLKEKTMQEIRLERYL